MTNKRPDPVLSSIRGRHFLRWDVYKRGFYKPLHPHVYKIVAQRRVATEVIVRDIYASRKYGRRKSVSQLRVQIPPSVQRKDERNQRTLIKISSDTSNTTTVQGTEKLKI